MPRSLGIAPQIVLTDRMRSPTTGPRIVRRNARRQHRHPLIVRLTGRTRSRITGQRIAPRIVRRNVLHRRRDRRIVLRIVQMTGRTRGPIIAKPNVRRIARRNARRQHRDRRSVQHLNQLNARLIGQPIVRRRVLRSVRRRQPIVLRRVSRKKTRQPRTRKSLPRIKRRRNRGADNGELSNGRSQALASPVFFFVERSAGMEKYD